MKIAKKTKFIAHAALIASLYTVLTYLTNLLGLANGAIQCRLSEAMCILPAFTPAAVPGLFIGCFISNLVTGGVIFDVIFGSLATLAGAVGTLCLSRRKLSPYLFPIPAILSNTVIIPLVLKLAYSLNQSIWYFVVTVGIGELISCGILGMLLYFSLYKKSGYLFK